MNMKKNIWGSVKTGKIIEVNERPLLFARRSMVNVGNSIVSRIYYLLHRNIICRDFLYVLTLRFWVEGRIYVESFQE